MKRLVTLLLVAMIAVAAASAEEAVLIDFGELTADYPADNPAQHTESLIDFSAVAGSSYSDEEKAEMKTSLFIENWEVSLSTSSSNVTTESNSYVRAAYVREGASNYENSYVMGIRVNFPTEPYHGWALVEPPFEIPAYMDADEMAADESLTVPQDEIGRGRKFDNMGVVKNVGVLKSVSVNVYGLNFPHGLSLLLEDERNREQEIFMGYLDFDGWRTLEWRNPNYITDVRNRQLRALPLYPENAPMRKLLGLVIYRDASMEGGDFISYVKDVSVVYDRALLNIERDIDDEGLWGILQTREAARRNAELRRLGEIQVLRYLEQRKMDQADEAVGGATQAQ